MEIKSVFLLDLIFESKTMGRSIMYSFDLYVVTLVLWKCCRVTASGHKKYCTSGNMADALQRTHTHKRPIYYVKMAFINHLCDQFTVYGHAVWAE